MRISLGVALVAAILAGVVGGVSPAWAAASSPYFTALAASGATELGTARFDAMAAPLPDGQVLIAGGDNESGYLQNAELFDPVDDTFTALAASGATELQTARGFAVAAALPDGRVLIAGGENHSDPLQSAEIFDPADDTFTALAAAGATELYAARVGAVAAPLPDGQVLITGGYREGSPLLSAELFDPTSETFAELPEAGDTELPSARAGAVAAALPDGQVLIAGGISGLSYLQSAELYYSAPQATVAGGEFGDETVGEPSPVAVLVVSNVGAQALSIAAASLEGADSADFAITADSCAGRRLAFEQSCTIAVRFTPTTTGETKASIALSDNEPSATAIALSGTGVAANSGPAGPAGPSTNGANGTDGKGSYTLTLTRRRKQQRETITIG